MARPLKPHYDPMTRAMVLEAESMVLEGLSLIAEALVRARSAFSPMDGPTESEANREAFRAATRERIVESLPELFEETRPSPEPIWSERSQRASWARFYPFIPPTEG